MNKTVALPSLLTIRQIMDYTNLGRGTIYALLETGEFPKPIKITTRCVRWLGDDISAWVEKLKEEQHG